jgi:mannan endo-1,4-beta-mannosidase
LTAAKDAGLTVFRTWGFNDKNSTYIPGGLPNYGGEGAGPSEVVFQWWHPNGTSTINLSGFDKVVNAADKVGIKLLVALTNNWADYGGMDVYTVNLGGKYHDDVGWPLSHLSVPYEADMSPVLHCSQDQGRF